MDGALGRGLVLLGKRGGVWGIVKLLLCPRNFLNMRLFDRAALSGVKLHFPDGRAWDGTGEWGYVREAVDL